MNGNAMGLQWIVGVSLSLGSTSLWAQVDVCEIHEADRYDNCAKALADSAGSNEAYRAECRQTAAERRAELADWGVDAKALSDIAIFDRYDRELVNRCKADREQTRRDSLERDRLAAETAAANAERARIAAAREKEAEEYGAQQMKAGQEMMNKQNTMLQGLGVNLGGMSMGDEDDEDLDDEEYSAIELQMYQKMVNSGAAPGCKGMTGAALVECVDEALDAEEE